MEGRDQAFLLTCAMLQLLLAFEILCFAATHRKEILEVIRGAVQHLGCFSTWLRPFEDDSMVAIEVIAMRVRMVKVYFSVLAASMCSMLAVLQQRLRTGGFAGTEFWRWSLVAFLVASLAFFISSRLRRARAFNSWYVALMTLCATMLLYHAASPEDQQVWPLTQISAQVSVFCRIPAVCLTNRVCLVAVCNAILVVMVALFSPLEGLGMEGAGALGAVIAAVALQVLLNGSARRKVSHKTTTSDLQASRALLHLICDAVIELDESLRLSHHSPELAAILLRDSSPCNRSLEGKRFRDFLATPEEAARAQEQLLARSKPAAAQAAAQAAAAFHTRLVDADNGKLPTEVFHVTYSKADGSTSHLLGLRDFTDQVSLAPPASLGAPVLENVSGSSALILEARTSSKSVQPDAPSIVSLQIDVAEKVVEAASLSAPDLVGMPVLSLLPSLGPELLRKACEAVDGGAVRTFSFRNVVVQWGPEQMDNIDGTAEILCTQGVPRLLLRCSGSFVSGTLSNPDKEKMLPVLPSATDILDLA